MRYNRIYFVVRNYEYEDLKRRERVNKQGVSFPSSPDRMKTQMVYVKRVFLKTAFDICWLDYNI